MGLLYNDFACGEDLVLTIVDHAVPCSCSREWWSNFCCLVQKYLFCCFQEGAIPIISSSHPYTTRNGYRGTSRSWFGHGGQIVPLSVFSKRIAMWRTISIACKMYSIFLNLAFLIFTLHTINRLFGRKRGLASTPKMEDQLLTFIFH